MQIKIGALRWCRILSATLDIKFETAVHVCLCLWESKVDSSAHTGVKPKFKMIDIVVLSLIFQGKGSD